MRDKPHPQKTATLLTHSGSHPEHHFGAVNVPPHRASTIVFDTLEDFEKVPNIPYFYGRAGTPSSAAFEESITALEGAYSSVATCSGLSAIVTTLMAFAKAGDHVLMVDSCYGPSRKSCEDILRRFGVDIEYYPPLIGADIAQLFRPNTVLVFMESPGSLTFEVQDIGAIVAAAKSAGIKTAIDNSWATPINLRPLDLGIDVSVMSATKYISGHSDAMIGVVSATESAWPAIRRTAMMLGLCAGSEELYLAQRGLRTLHLRMKQHQDAALHIATWLSTHSAVKRVLHPALPDARGHAAWKKYYSGSSGTFGVVLHETDHARISAMLNHMRLFRLGFSWGGFESLLFPEQPHAIRTAEPWTDKGYNLRLHIGLEDVNDLVKDLEDGLKRLICS